MKAKIRWSIAVAGALLVLGGGRVNADVYLSNLSNQWPGPPSGDIGDILVPRDFEFDARFSTGPDSFLMNSLTLEFIGTPSQQALSNLSIRLFQQVDDRSLQVGGLGNATPNPAPTQWPQSANPNNYTVHIDFHPLTTISLQPVSHYMIAIQEVKPQPSLDVGLLFTISSEFTSRAGWQMGRTTGISFRNPLADVEFLKLAVDATQVSEPFPTTLLLFGCVGFTIAAAAKRRGSRTFASARC